MKKLVVCCFTFVATLMLVTNVFAGRQLSITEYTGNNGIMNRGDSIQNKDTLNVKNDIKFSEYSTMPEADFLQYNVTMNGNGHVIDGGGNVPGFRMDPYNSAYTKSEINDATIQHHCGTALTVGHDDWHYTTELTLNNVNVVNNIGAIVVNEDGIVNIVSNGKQVKFSNGRSGIQVNDGGELNLKGDNILIEDNIRLLGVVNNSSNLFSYGIIYDGYIFNNSGTIDSYGQFYEDGDLNNTGTINLYNSNDNFTGYLYVTNGTIRLGVKTIVEEGDSYDIFGSYFNNAIEHFYSNGTLDAANGVIDDVVMQSLGLEGSMKINMDVDLAEQA